MSIRITPGQAGDNPQLLPLLDHVQVRRDRPGRPRQQPDRVLADKTYSHPSTRRELRTRRVTFSCPERGGSDRLPQSKEISRRSPTRFDAEVYRGRNRVERCFARLKQFRDLATRYAKRLAYWRSELVIATIVLWLR